MHLLADQPGIIADGAAAVDLGQTPGDIVVLSSADTEIALLAAAQARAAPRIRLRRRLRLANLLRLGHNFSVDLYMETVAQRAAGHRAAARRPRLLALRRRAAGRDLPRRAASRWRCCPATTSPIRSWRGSRPCRRERVHAAVALSRRGRPGQCRQFPALRRAPDRRRGGRQWARAGAAAARRAVLARPRDAEPRRHRRRMARRRRRRPDRLLPGARAVGQHRAGRCAGRGARRGGCGRCRSSCTASRTARPRRCSPRSSPPTAGRDPQRDWLRAAPAAGGDDPLAAPIARSCRWYSPAATRNGAPAPAASARATSR